MRIERIAEPKPHAPGLAANHVLFSAVALGLLTGCRGGPGEPEIAAIYDHGRAQQEVLDIQVFRDGTSLELTNTTARAFGEGTLWVNQRYALPIDGLELGESLRLPLGEFRDQYGDTFRAGGFFATRDPDLVVLTQLETAEALYGLVVVGNRIE